MRLLYSFFIYSYYIALLIASLFNAKARKWLNGRRNLFHQLSEKIKGEQQVIWVHCASVGEFEQGRPLIEYLKKNNTEIKILLTFFSPSGYELRKNYAGADFIFYLPLDTTANAVKFIEIVNPKAAIIVKYEFWYNHLTQLQHKRIPYFLVSANFREDQYFFKWYGTWFAKQLRAFTHIFVQEAASENLLRAIGVSSVSVVGDTRFDRVAEIVADFKPIPVAASFSANSKVVIAGSTWPADEHLLVNFINTQRDRYPELKFILVPHEINPDAIASLAKTIADVEVVRFSEAAKADLERARVLIVDNVGLLSRLYYYGHIAFVGGGFGKGIHNILEPAAFGLPIIFGPNYTKFNEAVNLINKGGACSITDEKGLTNAFAELLNNTTTYKKAKSVCSDYVAHNTGATSVIGKMIRSVF